MIKRPKISSNPTFTERMKEPVVANRGLDFVAAAYWVCYAIWGVLALIYGVPTLKLTETGLYQKIWGGTVGFMAGAAAVAAIITFKSNHKIKSRIRCKSIELMAVCVMLGFIMVYPVALSLDIFTLNEFDRLPGLPIAVSFIIFPLWRVMHLIQRLRILRSYQEIL